MKYFDAFSGYGGFSLGIQQAYEDRVRGLDWQAEKGDGEPDSPIESLQTAEADSQRPGNPSSNIKFGNIGEVSCIGFSEIDKYAVQIYQKHFPYEECENCRLERNRQEDIRISGRQETLNGSGTDLSQAERPDGRIGDSTRSQGDCRCKHKPYGDITKINASELPDFDLFVGGFPCQAFSIAGKRGGFEDTRGTLIYDVLRIVKEKHPRIVLLENVKGLLSHDGGRTFKTIITSLTELGYAVEWQVLNAKNFGVPQNRERVFIIGHLGGFGGRQVFPIGEIASNGSPGDEKGRSCEHSSSIISSYGKSNCHGTYVPEDIRIRRLTPTECERLMGLPDGWTEGVSDTQRYKLCGNGVVVNVVEEIVKRLTNNHKE